MNAALDLLVKKGIHNTPMSEIARAAGTGMGTIYNYFPNKEELINEIYVNIRMQEKDLFLEVDTTHPIKTRFEDYLTVLIEFFLQQPSYFNFLLQLEASPIITDENRKKGRESVEIVADLLKSGQESRVVKNMEIGEILTFIGGGIYSYLRQHMDAPEKERTSLSNHIQMVWDGIKE